MSEIPKCGKCGREMELDLLHSNEADYICFWCDDFHVKAKETELISKILDDLTLNHPMIGFKYTREELIEKWEKLKNE